MPCKFLLYYWAEKKNGTRVCTSILIKCYSTSKPTAWHSWKWHQILSVPLWRSAICGPFGAPPYTLQCRILQALSNRAMTCATCCASSLVGTRTKHCSVVAYNTLCTCHKVDQTAYNHYANCISIQTSRCPIKRICSISSIHVSQTVPTEHQNKISQPWSYYLFIMKNCAEKLHKQK